MSITLFHCSNCNNYSKDAAVSVIVGAELDVKRGMLRVGADASLPEGFSIPLEDVVESLCNECDSLMELVTLDECPHRWQSRYGDSSNRVCEFCGMMQQGRVVFDE